MKVVNPNPAGLIATHAALSSGVHGIGTVIATLIGAETLTNKLIGAGGLTFDNESSGGNPVLSCSSTAQILTITGTLELTKDYYFKSATAYNAALSHANSATRVYTFPDVAGNVIIDADTGKSISLAQLTIENVGAGNNCILLSDSAAQYGEFQGGLTTTLELRTLTDLKIRSGTAFYAAMVHNNSAIRTYTYPDVDGTVCMWDAANAAVTRYWSLGGSALACMTKNDGTNEWIWDVSNTWADSVTTGLHGYPVHLPHGSIVTALRVTGQETGSGVLHTSLRRVQHSNKTAVVMAVVESTSSWVEVADTSITSGTIDNNTYAYYLEINHGGNTDEIRLGAIQIDYTVTEPYA